MNWWLKKVFPEIFCFPWTENHLRALIDINQAVFLPGHKRIELGRDSGSTSLMFGTVAFVLSSVLASFVLVVCRTQREADSFTQRILAERAKNEEVFGKMPLAGIPAILCIGEGCSFRGLAVCVDGTSYRPDMVFIDNGVRDREQVLAKVRGCCSPGTTPRIIEFVTSDK